RLVHKKVQKELSVMKLNTNSVTDDNNRCLEHEQLVEVNEPLIVINKIQELPELSYECSSNESNYEAFVNETFECSTNIRESLQNWMLRYRHLLSQEAMDELLKLLKPVCQHLPKDSRTFLKTPNSCPADTYSEALEYEKKKASVLSSTDTDVTKPLGRGNRKHKPNPSWNSSDSEEMDRITPPPTLQLTTTDKFDVVLSLEAYLKTVFNRIVAICHCMLTYNYQKKIVQKKYFFSHWFIRIV
ncbi:hypothetical protein RN001_010200, partial [Aquatica leii]